MPVKFAVAVHQRMMWSQANRQSVGVIDPRYPRFIQCSFLTTDSTENTDESQDFCYVTQGLSIGVEPVIPSSGRSIWQKDFRAEK